MNDLISRKAAIEAVEDCAYRCPKMQSETDYNCGVESSAMALESLAPAVNPEPRWIPVTERLPEEMTPVLTWSCPGNFMQTARWDGSEWKNTWNLALLRYVTHWMPLPERPKEVE